MSKWRYEPPLSRGNVQMSANGRFAFYKGRDPHTWKVQLTNSGLVFMPNYIGKNEVIYPIYSSKSQQRNKNARGWARLKRIGNINNIGKRNAIESLAKRIINHRKSAQKPWALLPGGKNTPNYKYHQEQIEMWKWIRRLLGMRSVYTLRSMTAAGSAAGSAATPGAGTGSRSRRRAKRAASAVAASASSATSAPATSAASASSASSARRRKVAKTGARTSH